MVKKRRELLDNQVPLFNKWSSWYWLIIVVNILFITGFYFYFNSL